MHSDIIRQYKSAAGWDQMCGASTLISICDLPGSNEHATILRVLTYERTQCSTAYKIAASSAVPNCDLQGELGSKIMCPIKISGLISVLSYA